MKDAYPQFGWRVKNGHKVTTRFSVLHILVVMAVAFGMAQRGLADDAIIVDDALVETKADPPCWPAPDAANKADRYQPCGNGTVLDTATGLLWTQRANCLCPPPRFICDIESSKRNWYEAQAYVAQLASGQCGLDDHSQPGDWRLPTAAEWDQTILVAVTEGCSAPLLTDVTGSACFGGGSGSFFDWVNTLTSYWALETTNVSFGTADQANTCSLSLGSFFTTGKTSDRLFWPVRGPH